MKRNKKGKLIPSDQNQVDKIRSKLSMVFQDFNLWSHMTYPSKRNRGPHSRSKN